MNSITSVKTAYLQLNMLTDPNKLLHRPACGACVIFHVCLGQGCSGSLLLFNHLATKLSKKAQTQQMWRHIGNLVKPLAHIKVISNIVPLGSNTLPLPMANLPLSRQFISHLLTMRWWQVQQCRVMQWNRTPGNVATVSLEVVQSSEVQCSAVQWRSLQCSTVQ